MNQSVLWTDSRIPEGSIVRETTKSVGSTTRLTTVAPDNVSEGRELAAKLVEQAGLQADDARKPKLPGQVRHMSSVGAEASMDTGVSGEHRSVRELRGARWTPGGVQSAVTSGSGEPVDRIFR
jgi:hypothetical protein